MAILEVLTVPNPILREVAKPVEKVDAQIAQLMRDMVETMYADDGIGLAANQIGVLERVIVVDLSKSRDGSEALMMANPEIIEEGEGTFTYSEGCLSVRPCATESTADLYANVTRPKRVKVKYLDIDGKEQIVEAEDLFSSCLQHEIDHLDGVLFVDHLSSLKRGMIMRKIEKLRRQAE
ncbi:MAG: peptide deformylase [Proteobacteria bacterium]|jgi:peptide deformylase|nr:peptide deformylase [Alphaproteobacteria bacterium]NCC02729.1 peptide deformylase [Pseudomonadota bacterium]